MSLGTVLKEAREARGLTTADVAEHTHIFVQIVESIERDDFSRIPAAVYGRGFIRRYAAFVGVKPDDLVNEFQIKFDELHNKRSAKHFNPAMRQAAQTPTPSPPAPALTPPAAPVEPPPVAEPAPAQELAPRAGEVPPVSEPPPVMELPKQEEPRSEAVEAMASATSGLPLFAEPPPSVVAPEPPPQGQSVATAPLKPKSTVPATPLAPPRRARAGAFAGVWGGPIDAAGPDTPPPVRKASSPVAPTSAALRKKISQGIVETARRMHELPPWVWRGGIVVAVLILLLVGIVKGCNAVKSMVEEEAAKPAPVVETAPNPAPNAAPATSAAPLPAPGEKLPFNPPQALPLKSTGDAFPGLYAD